MDIGRKWKDILYIGLGLFLISVLLLRADVTDTLDILKGTRIDLIALVLLLYFFNIFCKVMRWHGLLKGMGARNTGAITLPIFLASLALNNSTPGKVGGEPVRAIMLKEHTGNGISKGIATIFAEKSMDILTILFLALLGLIYLVNELGFEDVKWMVIAICMGGSIIVLVILLLVNRRFLELVNSKMERTALTLSHGKRGSKPYRIAIRLQGAIDRYHSSLRTIVRNPWCGTGTIILTIAIWINEALRFYLVVMALPGNVQVTFMGAVAAISVANILGFILPIGAGNVFGSKSILELLSVKETTAMAASLLQVATSLWISIPLGLISLAYLRTRSKKAGNQ
ncbi:MAG: flippase-like domain-containing protein [Candidatus Thermoplasmatota archaeon]|nr:flippase-like domain-containing protein [Candidatus Thermoplasmatota archaeon]